MPLRFTNPDELMEIFSTLEEKNLFMIELCQNVEMQFEERKQREKQIKTTYTAEVETLRKNEEQNHKRIEKSQNEKDALTGIQEDQEGKTLDPSD